jgi:dihydroflavonol-4-reductase
MRQGNNVLLLTGATGFLGHTLCPYLVRQGHRVRALVRPTSDYAFLESLGVELAWGDLRNPEALTRAVQGCCAIIHAGGKFRFWGKREDFFTVNVEGARCLLEAACQAEIGRFIYISTIAVVGRPPPGAVITEETPCEPQDAYQESKLAAERLTLTYQRELGLPALILRPGAYYGPWGRYGFNRLFFEDPLKGLPVQVHGGRHVVFPVYVGDVARAVETALTRGHAGEIYNLCGPCLSHREIGEMLERLLGRPVHWINVPAWGMVALARCWTWISRLTRREPYYPIGLYPYVFYDWQVSTEKARRELGFEPTSFEEGAQATLEWYRAEGILRIGLVQE